MPQSLTIYVCDDNPKAQQAKAFLELSGFTTVTVEQAPSFNYDATRYDGGGAEVHMNKFIVIGRR